MTTDAVHYRIANTLEAVNGIHGIMEEFGIRNSLDRAMLGRLTLVLEEILTNVVRHAYPDRAIHSIDIALTVEEGGGVYTEVRDDGVPFDPLNLPAPDLSVDVLDRREGGLGVHFLRSLMTGISHRRDDRYNILTFRTPPQA